MSLPVFLLAWTTPCLIEALTQEGFSAGLISGRIYGFSTMGGLLGTMLPTLFLIPLLGVASGITWDHFGKFTVKTCASKRTHKHNLQKNTT